MRLDEDKFVERFKPETDENGDLYRQRDWCDAADWKMIEQAAGERRLWTAVENDHGNWTLVNGFHRVNRLYYVICAVPYAEGDDFEVYDELEEEIAE